MVVKRTRPGSAGNPQADEEETPFTKSGESIRRAFAEFLKIPGLVIVIFLALATGTMVLDRTDGGWLEPLSDLIRRAILRDSRTTSDLLATLSGSIITVTSITFSLLLLAVQQAASGLTHQIYDQFLLRRANQILFGFFVGLAVYTLVIFATVSESYNPVFGATIALALAVVALVMMILLIYTTINQMRPVVVIAAIHRHIIVARHRQHAWLRRTRRTAQLPGLASVPVQSDTHGYVVTIDLDILGAAINKVQGEVEIILRVSMGGFVAFQDTVAEIRTTSPGDVTDLVDAVRSAIRTEEQRELESDAAFGVQQLAVIAWTSVSTAKSNPWPGLLVVNSFRDLLARWSADESEAEIEQEAEDPLPVVYTDDLFEVLLDAFENLTVVASESMQPQTATELVNAFAQMFDRLPRDRQRRVEDIILRSLSALGEHVLTAGLNSALNDLTQTLDRAGRHQTATRVRAAHDQLAGSVGRLGSRAIRATESS